MPGCPTNSRVFIKSRKIYASFLALYALIENRRHAKEPLFVAFVDVRKAFPTVKRDILFQKLAALGADDSLIRAVWDLYDGAKGTVRGVDGYGEFFDVLVGTREGGIESSLLYVLFVADLLADLAHVRFTREMPQLGRAPVRALQLADDLALIAHSAEDLQALLDQWGRYCDSNHQETQTRKTEVTIFLPPHMSDLSTRDLKKEFEFRYKVEALEISAHFVYLGVWFDAVQDASASYSYREGIA